MSSELKVSYNHLVYKANIDLSINTTISEIYEHFTKARSDQTLDRMYYGLKKKLKTVNCSVKARECILINIYIAYGRRQEYFDEIRKNEKNFQLRKVESIMEVNAKFSPEEQMGALLRSLDP